MGFALSLDPAGTELALSDANGYAILELDAPEPALVSQYASAAGVDGAQRVASAYANRTIAARVRVTAASADALENAVQVLQAAVTKQHREGGTLEVTTPAGTAVTFDVLDANVTVGIDQLHSLSKLAVASVSWTCLPFGRGVEVEL